MGSRPRRRRCRSGSSRFGALRLRRIQGRPELPAAVSFHAVQYHPVETQIHDAGEVAPDDGFPRRVPEFDRVLARTVGTEGLDPGGLADAPLTVPLEALVLGIADVDAREHEAARADLLELQ